MPNRRTPTVTENRTPNIWLRTRLSPEWSNLRQDPVDEQHARSGGNKNEPALEEMKETFRVLWPPNVGDHTCTDHAQCVAGNSDGHHQDDQKDSCPIAPLDEVT